MSADNTIVVLSTNRTFYQHGATNYNHKPLHKVYRVSHVQAWDSFDYCQIHQPYNVGAYLLTCFKHSPVFLDKGEALTYAETLLEEIGYVEYGIFVQDTDYFFYGEY